MKDSIILFFHGYGSSVDTDKFTGIVFTGGIGENSVTTRTRILEVMRHFGIKVDADKNAGLVGGNEGSFHADDSSLELWVVPTDEECRIAQETRAALGLK